MSTEKIYNSGNLTITRYCGPERTDGGSRIRYQWASGSSWISIPLSEMEKLKTWFEETEQIVKG